MCCNMIDHRMTKRDRVLHGILVSLLLCVLFLAELLGLEREKLPRNVGFLSYLPSRFWTRNGAHEAATFLFLPAFLLYIVALA